MAIGIKVKKSLGVFFTFGAMLAIGALSFIGTFAFTSALYICGMAFLGGSLIEGPVFWEHIIALALLDSNFILRTLLREFLREKFDAIQKADPPDPQIQNLFISEYKRLTDHLSLLQKNHDSLNKEQHIDQENTKKRLAQMEEFFLKVMQKRKSGEAENNPTAMEQAVQALMTSDEYATLLRKAGQKKLLLIGAFFIALGAGFNAFFAMSGAFQAGMVALSFVIPGGIIAAAAGFAAVGYFLLLFQAFKEVLVNNVLGKWWQKIQERYKEFKKSNDLLSIVSMGIAIIIVSGFAIFTTIATAGTWYKFAGEGSLIWFTDAAANIIQFTVCLVALPYLFFNLSNSLETSLWLTNIKKAFTQLGSDFNEAKKEPRALFWNPFRPIIKILKIIVFVWHIITDALAGDGFPDPQISTPINCGTSACTDLHYFFHPEEKDEKTGKIKNSESHESDEETIGLIKPAQTSDAQKRPRQSIVDLDNKHHNHSHAFENFLLFLPRLLAVIWDTLFNFGTTWSEAWRQACEKFEFFAHKPNGLKLFSSSAHWLQQEVIELCDEHIESYSQKERTNNTQLSTKVGYFAELKDEIRKRPVLESRDSDSATEVKASDTLSSLITKVITEDKDLALSAHRSSIFAKGSTKSKVFLDSLKDGPEYQSLRFGG